MSYLQAEPGTCETCRFTGRGCYPMECRRHPPAVYSPGGQQRFPLVYNHDWCGDHEPKAATEAK